MYTLYFTKQAIKDAEFLKSAKLHLKCQAILAKLVVDPYAIPFEKLIGSLAGCYSRRINIKHRLIYQIYESEKAIKILRMWSHYE